jgi:hypothetical protein
MVEQHPEPLPNERLPTNRRNYSNRSFGISDKEWNAELGRMVLFETSTLGRKVNWNMI